VEKWPEFKRRYREELTKHKDEVADLRKRTREGTVTFVYAAKDTEHNSAAVLKEFIEKK
jgi:uncharacterized protein YeaO (DUF488 family)